MTKLELVTAVKNIIDELDTDTQIDSIINSGIDFAYRYDLAKIDKRLSTSYLPVVNGMATLPSDMLSIESISPVLGTSDRIVGNAILTAQDTTFTLIYSLVRDVLSDKDELDLNQGLINSVISYCCYMYYKYKKKLDVANQYIQEYENSKQNYIMNQNNNVIETVVDVYATDTEGDDIDW